MAFTIGSRVSHVQSFELGVVLGFHGNDVEVAFGSATQILDPSDLIAAPSDDTELLRSGTLADGAPAFLRLLARLIAHSYEYDPGAGLSNARLEPQLHQAFVAHRVVARKLVPRMILADEVGLGKTIEAGLIVKELRARGLADRVLIVTPASLKRQWQVELQSKFNEQFEIMDGDAAKHFGRNGTNPFNSRDSIICSLPFATTKKRQEQIVEASWDLVIFDEAHRVRRTTSSTTQAYRLADELKHQTPGLLLLSATPIQLHPMELYSLIDLVEPGLFSGFQSYERERQRIPRLNEAMKLVNDWPARSSGEKAEAWVEHGSLLSQHGVEDESDLEDADRRDAVMDRIIESHPTADLMVRNRKAELGIGAKRNARKVVVPLTEQEQQVYEAAVDYIRYSAGVAEERSKALGFLMASYLRMLTSSSNALRISLRRRLEKLKKSLADVASLSLTSALTEEEQDAEELSETLSALEALVAKRDEEALSWEIARLTSLIDALSDIRDSKAMKLFEVLQSINASGPQKVVLFTQFIETQRFLKETLEHNGFQVTTFNGRMGSEEKEDAIRHFREDSQILVSTEAGGEGRNLQFSHVLINYDLPWNPMKVEQRIGRLDRIGQTHVVDIFNLVYEGTLEERIVDVLHNRIQIFEESVGSLDPILGTLADELQEIALNCPLAEIDGRFDDLGSQMETEVKKARLLEETMADFVLDRASFRKDKARELLETPALATNADLKEVILRGLDYLGGNLGPHVQGGEQISLSPKLASRLAISQQAHHGVFDPQEALRMDEVPFFACGHTVIDRLLSSLSDLDAHVGARYSSGAPAGLSVEIIWRLKANLVIPEARLVRHLVTPNLELVESDVEALPLEDVPVEVVIDPEFAAAAIEVSKRAFESTLRGYRQEMSERAEDVRERRLRRLGRVYKSNAERVQARIEEEEAFINRALENPTPQNQRILPARQGRLAKDRERLTQLQADFEHERDDIAGRRADIRGEIFSVSILKGP